jgi:hypothetical protein
VNKGDKFIVQLVTGGEIMKRAALGGLAGHDATGSALSCHQVGKCKFLQNKASLFPNFTCLRYVNIVIIAYQCSGCVILTAGLLYEIGLFFNQSITPDASLPWLLYAVSVSIENNAVISRELLIFASKSHGLKLPFNTLCLVECLYIYIYKQAPTDKGTCG